MEASKFTSDYLYCRVFFPKIKSTIKTFLSKILAQAIEINKLSAYAEDEDTSLTLNKLQIDQLRRLLEEDVDEDGFAGFLKKLKEFFSEDMFLCDSNNSFSEYLKEIAAYLYLDYASRSAEADLMEQLARVIPFESDEESVNSTVAIASTEEAIDRHTLIEGDSSILRALVGSHSML